MLFKNSIFLQQAPRAHRKTGLRSSLSIAIYEGMFAVVMINLLNPPFLTGYLLYLGATSSQIGIVLAFPFLANVSQIWMAFYMQRMKNRKATLIIATAIHRVLWVSTGLIPFLFPQELWMAVYIPVYMCAFLGNAAVVILWTSLMADIVPAQIRGRYFGLRNTILGAVSSVAIFVGGLLLDYYPGGTGFSYIFIIAGIAALINIFTFFKFPNIPLEKSVATNRKELFLRPFHNRMFLKAMIFLAIWLLLQSTAVPFFSYIMLEIMEVNYVWVSSVTIALMLVAMISNYIWGNLNAKYSTRRLLLWTFPIIAASCLLWGVVPFGIWLFGSLLLIHILLGIGTAGYNLLVFNFTIGDTPKSDRPMYIAVFAALTGFAAFIGSTLGGFLYEWVKVSPKWFEISGISAGVGILLLILGTLIGPLVFRER